MLNPTICSKCFQPNEASRALCWKCLHKLAEIDDSDYIRLFGLKGAWSKDDLKAAYRLLARKHHPDLNPENRETEAVFKFINQAFEKLSRLDGPPKPKDQSSTPTPKPAPGASKRLEMASDQFDILGDFVKDKNAQKAPPPADAPRKSLSGWIAKIFGR